MTTKQKLKILQEILATDPIGWDFYDITEIFEVLNGNTPGYDFDMFNVDYIFDDLFGMGPGPIRSVSVEYIEILIKCLKLSLK